MSDWRIKTMSPADTQRLGRVIGSRARPGDVIALRGELGAGKTQLVKGIAAGLGLDPQAVASPTFVLMHEYESADESDAVLIHIDAYRLKSAAELDTLGFEDAAGESVVVIEWADRVADALPDDLLILDLEHAGGEQRIVACDARGDWEPRMQRPITDDLKPTPCPTCGEASQPDGTDYPFCSKRCRLADLNKWFDESYRISRPIEQADLDEDV